MTIFYYRPNLFRNTGGTDFYRVSMGREFKATVDGMIDLSVLEQVLKYLGVACIRNA